MMTHTNARAQAPGEIDDNVIKMIALIDDLIAIIEAENCELGTGVPASLSSAIERKASLASQLEQWVDAVRNEVLVLGWAAPHLRKHLERQAAILDQAVNENMTRLRAAIDATRGRVDAVMRAIREQGEGEGPYRANGRAHGNSNIASIRSGRLA
jgi:flagellar biosynthesis/type III secretory pathway chaperone